ncbi:MAG TPA: hypothetical protein VGM46_08465 [Mesorhizobium sp.]
MNIYGSSSVPIDRNPAASGRSTYASANNVRADETKREHGDVDAARSTALSALKNDRFGTMLKQLSDPGTSGALMTMKPDADGPGADYNSVLSSYAENE